MNDYSPPCNFEDLRNHYKNDFPKVQHILLAGNGFNINFGIDTSYKNIYKEIVIVDVSGFFEDARSRNEDLEDVLESMSDKESQKLLLNWLYFTLIKIISNSHDSTKRMADYIKKFKKVFTINFDFLIYRAQLAVNDKCSGYFKDGFSRANANKELIWSYPKSQNIFYLHGGFHIIKTDKGIIKLASNQLEKLPEAIDAYKNKNPEVKIECIFRPTSEKKMEDIEDNPYTKYALGTLRTIEGIVFLYGVSLNEKDRHIWDAIDNNPKITFVNISYHGNSYTKGRPKLIDVMNHQKFMDFVDKANQAFPRKYTHFFDSQSIHGGICDV